MSRKMNRGFSKKHTDVIKVTKTLGADVVWAEQKILNKYTIKKVAIRGKYRGPSLRHCLSRKILLLNRICYYKET